MNSAVKELNSDRGSGEAVEAMNGVGQGIPTAVSDGAAEQHAAAGDSSQVNALPIDQQQVSDVEQTDSSRCSDLTLANVASQPNDVGASNAVDSMASYQKRQKLDEEVAPIDSSQAKTLAVDDNAMEIVSGQESPDNGGSEGESLSDADDAQVDGNNGSKAESTAQAQQKTRKPTTRSERKKQRRIAKKAEKQLQQQRSAKASSCDTTT